ncbi:MAG: hypothetical protein M5U26_26885 [Planctomycetota bacterium]|nr:hypothetical protein [Planctomycetota bacterium]
MTEGQLQIQLERGIWRFRLNDALRWGCAGLGLALAGSALAVVVARIWPAWEPVLANRVWLAGVAALGVAIWGYAQSRPSPERVALRLDGRAGLAEHLTTWLDLRRRGSSGEPWSEAFREAQKNATLRAAESLDASACVPLALPAWSRGLWLGLLALGCALLMPEQDAARERPEGLRLHETERTQAGGGAAGGPVRPLSPVSSGFRVNPLSPQELYEARLYASDEQFPLALKEAFLAKLEGKVAGRPESELDDEVRRVLSELRRQTGKESRPDAPEAGSQVVAGAGEEAPHSPALEQVGAPEAAQAPAELVGVARIRFPDVSEALARYYEARPPEL